MKVSAKTKDKPAVEVEIASLNADNLATLTKTFGEECVFSNAKAAIVISAQATMRRHIEKGANAAAIAEAMKAWRPDVRSTVKMSAFEKASSAVTSLSTEERAVLLKQLTAK